MQTTIDSRALVEAIGDAVVAAGTDGAISLWNPAAERMFGHTEAEALGKSLDLIIPQRQQQRHWDGYHKTMATGITRYGSDLFTVRFVTLSNVRGVLAQGPPIGSNARRSKPTTTPGRSCSTTGKRANSTSPRLPTYSRSC